MLYFELMKPFYCLSGTREGGRATLREAVWSRGMILRLGRRGRRFESANGPGMYRPIKVPICSVNCVHFASASLAQWLERSAVNRKVAGSIPAGGAFIAIQTVLILCCVAR